MSPVAVQMWDEVEERERGEFKTYPAGTYDGYFADWERRTPKVKPNGTQNPDYYSLRFTLTDPESEEEFSVWGIGAVTPKAIGFFKADLKAIGASWPTGLSLEEFVEDHLEDALDKAKNTPCRVKIKIASYEAEDDDGNAVSREKNEITRVLAAN